MPRKRNVALDVALHGTEHQNQAMVMQWAQAREGQRPELALLHAIPNFSGRMGKATAFRGAQLKREGRKPGVPDLCLPVPRGGFHGFYGELKAGKGKASEAQKWWLAELAKQGYYVVLRTGWEAMVLAIDTYLAMEPWIGTATQEDQ